ncbi:protein phosphatase 1 regulatory subunit 3E [Clarias gariepinus]|uniref:protein phosphatase 1 regulatory subunit 3E n=1 Tax=Clarias gariepinus TaxID=13013 RepID=UPI00234C8C02|nr:protein phosphatase 1 regulatory subunit 3E [Clarias gariepinus]
METETTGEVVVMLPPKNCLPRNYSCIAGLFGSLTANQKMDDGDKTEGEEEEEEEEEVTGEREPLEMRVVDERPRGRESLPKPPPSPGLRRRCKSLPSSAERAKLEVARICSPSSQKKVRFADSLGLELISVRHFDDTDVPETPDRVLDKFKKARALHLNNFEQHAHNGYTQSTFVETQFTCPGAQPDFRERLKSAKVLLESVETDEFSISGVVRVLNLAFEKHVTLRYTLNNWLTFVDVPASYVPNSSDGGSDRFQFKIVTPAFLESSGSLQFAVRYRVGPDDYWDNHDGKNYRVRRHRFKISPPREWDNGWIHFI